MRRKHAQALSVVLAAGALMLAACGEDDSPKAQTGATTQAPPGEGTAQTAPQPETSKESSKPQTSGGATATEDQSSSTKKQTTGGASDNGTSGGGQQGGSGGDGSAGEPSGKESKPKRPLTKKERLERHLRDPDTARDVYRQGKKFCSSFGLKEIAKSWHIMSSDPREVARRYANIYEQQYPRLRLPYYQGCVAGFKQREKRDARKQKTSE